MRNAPYASGAKVKRAFVGMNRLIVALAASRVRQRPFYFSHLVTTRCNCRCPTCIWRDNRSTSEMSAAEIGRLYRQGRRHGFKAVGLWGGEPLLRDDLAEILFAAKREGFITTLLTNGYYLEERTGELHDKLDSVVVSLDYPDEEHDRQRGCRGLFQRVVGALETLNRRYPEMKVMVNCLLHRGNEDWLLEMAELCQKLRVSFYVCPVKVGVSPETGHSVKGWEAEGETAAARALAGLKKNRYPLNNSYTYLERFLTRRESYVCHLPKISLLVYPGGEVANCTNPSAPLGNVRKEPLGDILESPAYERLKKQALHCNHCNNPNIVETSYMWDFKPEPLWNALKVLAKY